jgi:hypothetical protein
MAATTEKPTTWYRVTAPLVYMKTGTAEGPRILGLNAGAPVPFDVPEAQLQHHISHGLVEPFQMTGPEAGVLRRARGAAPGASPEQVAAGAEEAEQEAIVTRAPAAPPEPVAAVVEPDGPHGQQPGDEGGPGTATPRLPTSPRPGSGSSRRGSPTRPGSRQSPEDS